MYQNERIYIYIYMYSAIVFHFRLVKLILRILWGQSSQKKEKNSKMKKNSPFMGFISPLDWCDDALEFGVVETVDKGEPGLMSLGVVFPADFCSLLTDVFESCVLLLLDTFCWAIRSCFLNFALRFWNHTWKFVK